VVGTADTLTPAAARAWEELGAAVVTVGGDVSECEGSFLADWLAANRTAVVRPDRYVYGVAREAGELRRLAEGLRAQLTRGSTVASGPAQ